MSFKVSSVVFAGGTGLGLRMCVLFEHGRNRNYRGLGLIFFVHVKVQFGNNDITVINGNLLVFCFCPWCLHRGDRYDALRACIGDSLCQKLHDLNVFLVSMTDTLFASASLIQLTSTVFKIIRTALMTCVTAE